MKNILTLCCLALLLMSCGSEDDSDNGLSCSEASQNTFLALTNYTNAGSSDFEAMCNAYKITLQQQKDACGDSSGTIQTIIDGLGDCSVNAVGVGDGNN